MHKNSVYSLFCFLHRTFLQYDSWGEDRCRQQISICRKCKTCIFLSFFKRYTEYVFFVTPPDLIYCWKKKSQVDYGATADELEIHFNGCGPVNRVTILCDRFSGHPKGWVQLVHKVYAFCYLTLFRPLEYNYKLVGIQVLLCYGLFSTFVTALLTSSSPIETLCRVLLVCMRPCSEEGSLRWGASHYAL